MVKKTGLRKPAKKPGTKNKPVKTPKAKKVKKPKRPIPLSVENHAWRRGELKYDEAAIRVTRRETTWEKVWFQAEADALEASKEKNPNETLMWRALSKIVDEKHGKPKGTKYQRLSLFPYPVSIGD